MTMKRLNLNKETLRLLDDAQGGEVVGGVMKPPSPTQAGLECSAYPYICITVRPGGCPILTDWNK